MILDNQLCFSSAQTLVVATPGVASTNSYDVSGSPLNGVNVGPNDTQLTVDFGIGDGLRPKIAASIVAACTTATGATLNVQFQGSTDTVTWTTYVETGPVAAALLTANTRIAAFDWPVRQIGAAVPRYYRLYYALAAGSFLTGSITACVALQQDAVDNLMTTGAGFTVGI
jgi:phage tail protein X